MFKKFVDLSFAEMADMEEILKKLDVEMAIYQDFEKKTFLQI